MCKKMLVQKCFKLKKNKIMEKLRKSQTKNVRILKFNDFYRLPSCSCSSHVLVTSLKVTLSLGELGFGQ